MLLIGIVGGTLSGIILACILSVSQEPSSR